MLTDIQNWCDEAKSNGKSSRKWSHLKQLYLVPGKTEDDLRASLNGMAKNNLLSIEYKPIRETGLIDDELAILFVQ